MDQVQQTTAQKGALSEAPYQTVDGPNLGQTMGQMLRPLWVFLGLLAAYWLVIAVSLLPGMGLNGAGTGPFQGGYLLLVITLVYFPIFIMTQIGAARAIKKAIRTRYRDRPVPTHLRLLPLAVLAVALLVVTVLTYYNYNQTNQMLEHCPTCAQGYPFNALPNAIATTILLSPYLFISMKPSRR